MADRRPPIGSPAYLVEIFRTWLDHRLEWDRTIDPQLMRRILKLAELGLEHPKSNRIDKRARDRRLALKVQELAIRYGTKEAKVRKRLRALSQDMRYRSDDALRKYIDRVRRTSI